MIAKRALAVVLCVCLFLTSAFCFSVSAGAVAATSTTLATLEAILSYLEAAKTLTEIYEYGAELFPAIVSAVSADGVARKAQFILIWDEIIRKSGMSEADFREIYVVDYILAVPNATYSITRLFELGYIDSSEFSVSIMTKYDEFMAKSIKSASADEICNYCFDDDGVIASMPNYSVEINDDSLSMSFKDFVAMTADYADRYGPKSTAEYISWRTDKRLSTGTGYSYIPLSFRADACFCGNDSWVTDVYLVPFCVTDGIYYYGTYQYHYYVYFDKDADGNYILDDNGRRIGYLKCDYYNMTVEDSPVNTVVITSDYYSYPYIDIPAVITLNGDMALGVRYYKTVTDYISKSPTTTYVIPLQQIVNIGFRQYISDDYTDMVKAGSGCNYLGTNVDNHDVNCDKMCDIGYYCSNKPIKMELDIDWSKFAEDDVVTLSGDTIYDCVITNNNGDTSTINEYITNNYTYITNNYGGDGSGSGGSSSGSAGGGTVDGNVTVGGNIDVGGSVDVNVNVDVNNGSGSGDSMPVDVDLDNYLAQTPEQAQPITQFISIFFDFLPPELLGLICLGVTVAIILRIWGR